MRYLKASVSVIMYIRPLFSRSLFSKGPSVSGSKSFHALPSRLFPLCPATEDARQIGYTHFE